MACASSRQPVFPPAPLTGDVGRGCGDASRALLLLIIRLIFLRFESRGVAGSGRGNTASRHRRRARRSTPPAAWMPTSFPTAPACSASGIRDCWSSRSSPLLINRCDVIEFSPQDRAGAKRAPAKIFAAWLEDQQAIGTSQVNGQKNYSIREPRLRNCRPLTATSGVPSSTPASLCHTLPDQEAAARGARLREFRWKNNAWLATAETIAGWNGFDIRNAGSGRSPVRKRSG